MPPGAPCVPIVRFFSECLAASHWARFATTISVPKKRSLVLSRGFTNVGLLFVKFDGATLRIRINGHATILDDPATLARHHGAKLVVRVVCELFSNCARSVHDLASGTLSNYLPRPGHEPPAPEWKSRDYIRDILPKNDPQSGQANTEKQPK